MPCLVGELVPGPPVGAMLVVLGVVPDVRWWRGLGPVDGYSKGEAGREGRRPGEVLRCARYASTWERRRSGPCRV